MSNGMQNGVLKLAKISNSSTLDDIKAIFNFNMDQLMVFGGGAKGDPGNPGSIGPQGDLGFCVYGDGNSDSQDEVILNHVIDEETSSAENNEGADLYINQYGVFKVTRGDNAARKVKTIFVWNEENSYGRYPFIIKKAEEQQQVQTQRESFWEDGTFNQGSGITPKDSKCIVLVGDNRYNNSYDPRSSAPLCLFNDGVILFKNRNDKQVTYDYVISAGYRERTPDFGRSGLFIGQVADTTVDNNIASGAKLPHLFLDYYTRKDKSIEPFCYIHGTTIAAVATPAGGSTGEVCIVTYKDKYDATDKCAFVNGVSYVRSGKTALTIKFDSGTMNIKGVVSCADINQGSTGTQHIDFAYDGDVSMNRKLLPGFIMGHIVNAYGPEHIEYYGSTLKDIGMQGVYISLDSNNKVMSMYITAIDPTPGKSFITDFNNDIVFVDFTFAFDIDKLK
jgi:hypothetical protein